MKMFKDQYIVVTGGAGFIGSCVIRTLNDRGYDNIIVVDDFGTDERWKNLVGKKYAEMVSPREIFTWLEGKESLIEAFIHLGACSSTVERDASFLFENNYRFTVRLAEYALENDHRFIYASSAATYGDGSEGFSDDHSELERFRPLNMYGYSKHMFDLWLKNQGLLEKVCGLKYFNVFGPNEYHKERMASAIFHFKSQIQNTGEVRLFKSDDSKYRDGGQLRDFIYVKDAARLTCDLLNHEAYGIFNIGTGQPNTWNTLSSSVFKGLDKPEKIQYIDLPSDLIGKYQNYTCADVGKLATVLSDKLNFTPFEDGVVNYVSQYLAPKKYW
ncbi:MAG: ADP-L-glycero-D-manno-heptose-6-epimerase [Chlamydiae bacterium]|nr:ADP-L-glycero-D-manno-heptose-6-epimerase [Chlamydiota bacterium]